MARKTFLGDRVRDEGKRLAARDSGGCVFDGSDDRVVMSRQRR